MNKPKLVAFNMYETWIDKGTTENPYKKLFSVLGIEKNIATQLSYLLMTSPNTIEDILPEEIKNKPNFDTELSRFYDDVGVQLSGLKLYPDFESTIQFLKNNGYQTAVVSNLSKLYAYPIDHMIPAGTFDYKALSFEVGTAKPDSKIFEELQKQSGISAQETIMIGDSFHADVKGAFAAGIEPIHINRSKPGITQHGRYTQISALKDIEELLRGF